jgi:hypothetical protein
MQMMARLPMDGFYYKYEVSCLLPQTLPAILSSYTLRRGLLTFGFLHRGRRTRMESS